jgi:internalin A
MRRHEFRGQRLRWVSRTARATTGFMAVTAFLAAWGCNGESRTQSHEVEAPAVPLAPATEPRDFSAAELRRQLGLVQTPRIVRTGGRITQVEFSDPTVSDLSPLRGLPLELLTAEGSPVADLSPLRGMPLRELYLRDTQIRDLSPLVDSPIEKLNVVGTQVDDLAPLRELPLDTLWIASTNVTDLSPLRRQRLQSLDLEATAVTDLSPLAEMATLRRLNIAHSAVTDLTPLTRLRLERLIFTPTKIEQGLDVIREMPSLQTIGTSFDSVMPADMFWSRYDNGELGAEAGSTRP